MIADPGDHDGLIIDVAEAAVAVHHAHGVMPGGTHEGESLLLPVLEDETGGRDGAARGSQMGIRGYRLNAGQAEMHALYVGVAAELGAVFRDAPHARGASGRWPSRKPGKRQPPDCSPLW